MNRPQQGHGRSQSNITKIPVPSTQRGSSNDILKHVKGSGSFKGAGRYEFLYNQYGGLGSKR